MKRAELQAGKTYAIVVGDKGLHEAWIAEVVDTAAQYRKSTSWRDPKSYYVSKVYPDHNAVLVRTLGGVERLVRLMDIRQEWTEEERKTYCEQRAERRQREAKAREEDSDKRDELINAFKRIAPELGIEGYIDYVSTRYGDSYQRDIRLKTHQLEQLVMVLFSMQKESV